MRLGFPVPTQMPLYMSFGICGMFLRAIRPSLFRSPFAFVIFLLIEQRPMTSMTTYTNAYQNAYQNGYHNMYLNDGHTDKRTDRCTDKYTNK